MYLLVFPFFCSFLSFPQKCLFMLVSFLPFSFCFVLIVSNIFQNKFLFLWTFNLIFGFPYYQKKSPCSNFHFDRAHSYTFISRFFFYLLTLFMFPLLCVYPTDVRSLFVHPPHCYSPFLLPKFFHKKLFSPFHCWKTFVLLFSLLHHSLFSSLSVKPLQLFFSFLVSSFFLCCIFNFVLSKNNFSISFFFVFFFFEKKKNLSHEKHSLFFLSSNVSCILFSSLFVFVHHVSHSP